MNPFVVCAVFFYFPLSIIHGKGEIMKVITATEQVSDAGDLPTIFLAGGITNCPEWQDDIIKKLEPYNHAVLLNPRRKDFPMNDPNASKEQIAWEFYALKRATIFSMWFSNADSDQPICMYELGRHMALREGRDVCIGVEPGYRREADVRIQTELVSPFLAERIADNLDDHIKQILLTLRGSPF